MAFLANEIMHSPKDIFAANLANELTFFDYRYTAPTTLNKLLCNSNDVGIAIYRVNFGSHKFTYSATDLFLMVSFIQNASKAIYFRHHTH